MVVYVRDNGSVFIRGIGTVGAFEEVRNEDFFAGSIASVFTFFMSIGGYIIYRFVSGAVR